MLLWDFFTVFHWGPTQRCLVYAEEWAFHAKDLSQSARWELSRGADLWVSLVSVSPPLALISTLPNDSYWRACFSPIAVSKLPTFPFLFCCKGMGIIPWPLWGSRSVSHLSSPPLLSPPRCSEEPVIGCFCAVLLAALWNTASHQCRNLASTKTSEERRLALLGFELRGQKKHFPWVLDSICCLIFDYHSIRMVCVDLQQQWGKISDTLDLAGRTSSLCLSS